MAQNDPFGKFRRLRAAIGSLLGKTGDASQLGMIDSYDTIRAEVKLVVPDELVDEYERLFGPISRGRSTGPGSLVDDARAAQQARAKLELLDGWLLGIIDEG